MKNITAKRFGSRAAQGARFNSSNFQACGGEIMQSQAAFSFLHIVRALAVAVSGSRHFFFAP
jgi:hypothetical protein